MILSGRWDIIRQDRETERVLDVHGKSFIIASDGHTGVTRPRPRVRFASTMTHGPPLLFALKRREGRGT